MNKLISIRILIIINFTIASSFFIIWLVNYYQIDTVIIGVFKELLTIPFLIAQIVFLVIGIKHLINHKRNILTIISVLLVVFCVIISVGSFF